MAVDTKRKRFSLLGLTFIDNQTTEQDRMTWLELYAGILATDPAGLAIGSVTNTSTMMLIMSRNGGCCNG